MITFIMVVGMLADWWHPSLWWLLLTLLIDRI